MQVAGCVCVGGWLWVCLCGGVECYEYEFGFLQSYGYEYGYENGYEYGYEHGYKL